ADSADDDSEHDELYHDAVRLVIEFGKASTSLLQRRLRIGYGRAAHLIDLMEKDGIVGAADGPKPREVLKKPDWLSEVEEALRFFLVSRARRGNPPYSVPPDVALLVQRNPRTCLDGGTICLNQGLG